MSNMNYCRFQNTLEDLQDCYEHLRDYYPFTEEEKRARMALILMCVKIAAGYEKELL